MAKGCPCLEDNPSISCVNLCKSERLAGMWKVCVDTRYDPQPIAFGELEISLSGLTDEDGRELYEIYRAREYVGSCYADSEQEARSKALAGDILEAAGEVTPA